MSLLGVGCYNSFQYLALHTSTPINVTLVGASVPVFMLVLGPLFYKQSVTARQVLGAALSIAGVLCVLGRGDWNTLQKVQLVIGDVYMLIAVLCWAWSACRSHCTSIPKYKLILARQHAEHWV